MEADCSAIKSVVVLTESGFLIGNAMIVVGWTISRISGMFLNHRDVKCSCHDNK